MRAVLWFTVAYTVLLLAYGITVGSELTFVYTGINLMLLVVFGVINRWARFPLPVLWGLSLVGLGNMLGGVLLIEGSPLYVTSVIGPVRYDKVFHAAAAFVCFFVAWAAMQRWSGDGGFRGGLLLLTFLVTMGGGAVVEIGELIGSSIGDVSVGDYGNNALDLVANATGAALGLLVVLVAPEALQAKESAGVTG